MVAAAILAIGAVALGGLYLIGSRGVVDRGLEAAGSGLLNFGTGLQRFSNDIGNTLFPAQHDPSVTCDQNCRDQNGFFGNIVDYFSGAGSYQQLIQATDNFLGIGGKGGNTAGRSSIAGMTVNNGGFSVTIPADTQVGNDGTVSSSTPPRLNLDEASRRQASAIVNERVRRNSRGGRSRFGF